MNKQIFSKQSNQFKNRTNLHQTKGENYILTKMVFCSTIDEVPQSPQNKTPLTISNEGCLLRFGGDLLSHECSTIGADRFNFSVRKGKRWSPVAKTA